MFEDSFVSRQGRRPLTWRRHTWRSQGRGKGRPSWLTDLQSASKSSVAKCKVRRESRCELGLDTAVMVQMPGPSLRAVGERMMEAAGKKT
jgi:hypothetical protein